MTLDIFYKIALIFIAVFNSYIAIKFFNLNREQSSKGKEQDRKISLFKTLVLEHNMSNFYSIIDSLENRFSEVLNSEWEIDVLIELESFVLASTIDLRIKFYSTFSAIDEELYVTIQNETDNLHANITIFLSSIVDNNAPYRETIVDILELVSRFKSNIVRNLYNYDVVSK